MNLILEYGINFAIMAARKIPCHRHLREIPCYTNLRTKMNKISSYSGQWRHLRSGLGPRLGYHKQTLHRTFSHKFNDFAIKLYIFVADNYALFYNLAKEATDKDTSKVLDGLLYNVSDLDPNEWFFDTGAYTEINFTAFAMLGKS